MKNETPINLIQIWIHWFYSSLEIIQLLLVSTTIQIKYLINFRCHKGTYFLLPPKSGSIKWWWSRQCMFYDSIKDEKVFCISSFPYLIHSCFNYKLQKMHKCIIKEHSGWWCPVDIQHPSKVPIFHSVVPQKKIHPVKNKLTRWTLTCYSVLCHGNSKKIENFHMVTIRHNQLWVPLSNAGFLCSWKCGDFLFLLLTQTINKRIKKKKRFYNK